MIRTRSILASFFRKSLSKAIFERKLSGVSVPSGKARSHSSPKIQMSNFTHECDFFEYELVNFSVNNI